uniref:Uncharacterized protein n=1 Tax=Arundo donax TaxID=35708 RepID=A0A0A9A1A8_ARUDO
MGNRGALARRRQLHAIFFAEMVVQSHGYLIFQAPICKLYMDPLTCRPGPASCPLCNLQCSPSSCCLTGVPGGSTPLPNSHATSSS